MILKKQLPSLCILALTVSTLMGCGSSDNVTTAPPTTPTTTTPADTSPEPFDFAIQNEVDTNIVVVSQSITIEGIDAPTTVSIIDGEYAIDSGEFTSQEGTIAAGQSIQLRLTSSATQGETVTATITIGDFSTTFEVTTQSSTADPFVIEAETLTLTGNVMVVDNVQASNEQAVGGFISAEDGIVMANAPASVAIRVTYSSSTDTAINLQLNGEASGTFDAPATPNNGFENIIAELDIAEGDQITLGTSDTSGNWLVDKLQWIDFPLQQVRTVTNSGVLGGDGISVSANGDIYISGGLGAGEVVKINDAGEASTFTSGLQSANGSAFDSQGNLFIVDYYGNAVYKVSPEGATDLFAENLDGPSGLYIDQQDNVIVGQYGAGFSGTAATVLMFSPEGEQSVLATGGGLMDVIGVVGDENGEIYAGNWFSGELYRITNGEVSLIADLDVTINMIDYARGYIYIGNSGRITRVSTDGTSETFSGSAAAEEIDGLVADANFVDPVAVAFSQNKNILYVYDGTTGNVRSITFAD